MDEVGATAEVRVNAGDDECRGGDAATYTHAHADALREGSLAGTESAGQHDEVAGGQDATEVLTQRAGLVSVVGFDGVGGDGLGHEGVPSVASTSPM